jgi:O-antigen/teichoic acid export membrane protein
MNLARRFAQLLRLRPFDTDSSEGRSNERYRLAVLAMLANLVSRGVSLIVIILTVSLTVPYLGQERFGAWMAVSSLAGILTFLDLGVGNALTNRVAEASADSDATKLPRTVSGGLGFLFVLALLITSLLFTIQSLVPWDRLIRVTQAEVNDEIAQTIKVFCFLFGFSIFTTGVQRVFHGMQRGFEVHLVTLFGSLLSLILLWTAAAEQAPIPWLLVCTMASPMASSLVLIFLLLRRRMLIISLVGSSVTIEGRHLLRVGGLFFLLQLATTVGWGIDSVIISSTIGAAGVAAFNIVQRLFLFVSQPSHIVNAPLWPAFADANARGDKKFIRSTLKRAMQFNLFFVTLGSIGLMLFGNYLIAMWTRSVVQVPMLLLCVYGIWVICETVGSILSSFLNGCNFVKIQVLAVSSLLIITVPLKYFLVSNFGIEEMIAGFILVYLANLLFWLGIVAKEDIKRKLF